MRHDDCTCNHGSGAGLFIAALLGGAAAGATLAYFTAPRAGADSRRRLHAMADDARDTAERLPAALRKATVAARDAFERELAAETADS